MIAVVFAMPPADAGGVVTALLLPLLPNPSELSQRSYQRQHWKTMAKAVELGYVLVSMVATPPRDWGWLVRPHTRLAMAVAHKRTGRVALRLAAAAAAATGPGRAQCYSKVSPVATTCYYHLVRAVATRCRYRPGRACRLAWTRRYWMATQKRSMMSMATSASFRTRLSEWAPKDR